MRMSGGERLGASQAEAYEPLVSEVQLRTQAAGGFTQIDIPALDPWAMLIVRTAISASTNLVNGSMLCPTEACFLKAGCPHPATYALRNREMRGEGAPPTEYPTE